MVLFSFYWLTITIFCNFLYQGLLNYHHYHNYKEFLIQATILFLLTNSYVYILTKLTPIIYFLCISSTLMLRSYLLFLSFYLLSTNYILIELRLSFMARIFKTKVRLTTFYYSWSIWCKLVIILFNLCIEEIICSCFLRDIKR